MPVWGQKLDSCNIKVQATKDGQNDTIQNTISCCVPVY